MSSDELFANVANARRRATADATVKSPGPPDETADDVLVDHASEDDDFDASRTDDDLDASRTDDDLDASRTDDDLDVRWTDDQSSQTIRRWEDTASESTAAARDSQRRPERFVEREDIKVVEPREQEQRSRPSWLEIPVMLLIAFTLAFLLRTFVVQVFYIPSGSMIPTLEINDRIIVEKLTYLFRDPARGEVVVFAGDDPFAVPPATSVGDRILTGIGQFLGVVPVDAKDFVKRVIGLPGDTVTIEDGIVSVNGVVLDEPYARRDQDDGIWVVPEGHMFVMGDNRANSGDSRSSLGFVPLEDVVGRVVAIIWPLEHAGTIPGVPHDAVVPDAPPAAMGDLSGASSVSGAVAVTESGTR